MCSSVASSRQPPALEYAPGVESLGLLTINDLSSNSQTHLQVRDGGNVDDLFLYAPDRTETIVDENNENGRGCATGAGNVMSEGHYYLVLTRENTILSVADVGEKEFIHGSASDLDGVRRFIVPGRADDFLLIAQYGGCRMVWNDFLYSVANENIKPVKFIMLDGTQADSFLGLEISRDGKTLESCVRAMGEDDKVHCHSFRASEHPADPNLYESRGWIK
jgi:hypothetical protein